MIVSITILIKGDGSKWLLVDTLFVGSFTDRFWYKEKISLISLALTSGLCTAI